MNKKQATKVFLFSALCALCSCGGSKAADQTGPLATDSVVCVKSEGDNIRCRITADYPNGGGDSLAMSVAAYIDGELARQYLPVMNSEDGAKKYPLYSGAESGTNAVAEYYATGTLAYLKSQAKEMSEAGMEDTPQMAYELSVRKTADNDRYVSYQTTSYAFLGGAHGSATDYTVNIAKPSGRVVSPTVDTLQVKAMQPILRKGVLGYLHEQGETDVTEKTLGDYLFVENGLIPLPVRQPYLADDGVHFIYQQYEIGPYAMGMVEFTVPYAEIKPFLSKDAAQLVR